MIHIHWHLVLYIVIIVFLLVKSGDDDGRDYGFGCLIYGVLIIFVTLVYGGIFWW